MRGDIVSWKQISKHLMTESIIITRPCLLQRRRCWWVQLADSSFNSWPPRVTKFLLSSHLTIPFGWVQPLTPLHCPNMLLCSRFVSTSSLPFFSKSSTISLGTAAAQTQLSTENKDHSFLRVAKSMLWPHQSYLRSLKQCLWWEFTV